VRPIVALIAGFVVAGCGSGGNQAFRGANGPHTDHHGIAIADFNGDGLDDIVAARVFVDPGGVDAGSVAIFLRDAAHPDTFLAPAVYPVETMPYAVAVADLNADGAPDVVVAGTFAESGFRLMLQAADGTLAPSTLIAAPAAIYGIATADIDGDGLTDVVAAADTELYLFTRDPATPGTFKAAVKIGAGSRRVVIADVDGDGLPDLVTPRDIGASSSEALVYIQDDAVPGTFGPAIAVAAAHRASDVAAADLDGDGVVDLGVAGSHGTLGTSKGDWSIFIQVRGNPPVFGLAHDYDFGDSQTTLIALADLDGNGSTDAVLGRHTPADHPAKVDVYMHASGNTFTVGGGYVIPDDLAATLPEFYDIKVADLNDDGLPDIVVSTNEIFLFPQRVGAPGTFGDAVRIAGQ
jgi:hypothetical protein